MPRPRLLHLEVVYDFAMNAKAVRALDFVGTSMYMWLDIVISRQPLATVCPTILVSGMKTALRSFEHKFRVLNRSYLEDVMFCAWFGKQSCVGFSHLRRMKRNSDKFQPATRRLPDDKRDLHGKSLGQDADPHGSCKWPRGFGGRVC